METKEVFFTFKDLKRLFLRKKRVYGFFLAFSFLIVLLAFLSGSIRYQATATFKESKQDHGVKGQSEFLLSVLQSAASFSREEGVQSMFASRTLLREVVEDLGLQIQKKEVFFLRLFRNVFDNFRAELGIVPLKKKLFHFSHVSSDTQSQIQFYLRFTSENLFEVWDGSKKQKLALGSLGMPIFCGEFSFQLDSAEIKQGTFYSFNLNPWVEVVKKVNSRLRIQPHKKDKGVLFLKFTDASPKQSADFLNKLMFGYQGYLRKENEEISSLQMSYLEKRQKELMEKYEESLSSHMEFLDQNLEGSGFMTLKQESEILNKPSEEYLGRLYDLDLELSRLGAHKKEEKKKAKILLDVEDPLEKLYAKRQEMLFQKDLEKQKALDPEMQNLWAFLDQKDSVSFEGKIPKDLSSGFLKELREISTCSLKNLPQRKGHLKNLLEKECKKSIEKTLFYELDGVSPETAQKLYVEYNEQLDSLRVYIRQLKEVKGNILLPEFEVASLSTLLTDSVSLEMIQKAGQKALDLQDKANYSPKDMDRIQNGLEAQKRFLCQHVQQILSLQDLKVKLIEEKISSLQQTSIHQLEVEKELIQRQLGSLKERMKSLPGKWKRENELKMQRDLSLSVMEGLTQLTESKNIDAELFHVGSKPIDLAFVPYKPHSRFSFSFSFLIALFMTLSFFIKDLFAFLSKGRVITEDFARHMGLIHCGVIGRNEKDTMQRVCSFLKKDSCALLLSEGSFPFEKIASLMGLRGYKVLLIQCFADSISFGSQKGGLYEYLSGSFETPPIIQKEGFDVVLAGVYQDQFGHLLSSSKFSDFVTTSRNHYDVVLLSMKGNVSDAVLAPLKDLTDLFVLHVSSDPIWEDVSEWARMHPASLAVVFSE